VLNELKEIVPPIEAYYERVVPTEDLLVMARKVCDMAIKEFSEPNPNLSVINLLSEVESLAN
jgi:hypothetical protein